MSTYDAERELAANKYRAIKPTYDSVYAALSNPKATGLVMLPAASTRAKAVVKAITAILASISASSKLDSKMLGFYGMLNSVNNALKGKIFAVDAYLYLIAQAKAKANANTNTYTDTDTDSITESTTEVPVSSPWSGSTPGALLLTCLNAGNAYRAAIGTSNETELKAIADTACEAAAAEARANPGSWNVIPPIDTQAMLAATNAKIAAAAKAVKDAADAKAKADAAIGTANAAAAAAKAAKAAADAKEAKAAADAAILAAKKKVGVAAPMSTGTKVAIGGGILVVAYLISRAL